MCMSVAATIVLDGLLKPDGTVELQSHPALPPGRVRVTLEAVAEASTETDRLPDGVCEGPMLDPWGELPPPENRLRLYPKLGELPLPDPPLISLDDGESRFTICRRRTPRLIKVT